MDDSKCKKSKANSLLRPRKNVKNKKTKKKANFRIINDASTSASHLFSQFRLHVAGKPQIKGKHGPEGMFFKGLRSEYITRESLNEANEARKNEDINKIIDIGKVFFKNQRSKQSTANKNSSKQDKSPVLFRKSSNVRTDDLEECPLSPISFAKSSAFPLKEDNSEIDLTIKNRKLDFEKEFKKFSSKYEQTVGVNVLLRLPDDGIFEDALKALRKKRNENLCQEFCPVDEFLKEFKFLNKNSDNKKATDENFMKKFFVAEIPTQGEENALIMTDVQSENYTHPSSLVPFYLNDVENLNALKFHQEFTKDLNIPTPPMQFYRRNMF